jgi:hypothetical protein
MPALKIERKALISFFRHTRNAVSAASIFDCLSNGLVDAKFGAVVNVSIKRLYYQFRRSRYNNFDSYTKA